MFVNEPTAFTFTKARSHDDTKEERGCCSRDNPCRRGFVFVVLTRAVGACSYSIHLIAVLGAARAPSSYKSTLISLAQLFQRPARAASAASRIHRKGNYG